MLARYAAAATGCVMRASGLVRTWQLTFTVSRSIGRELKQGDEIIVAQLDPT
jgi:hypothetical protein